MLDESWVIVGELAEQKQEECHEETGVEWVGQRWRKYSGELELDNNDVVNDNKEDLKESGWSGQEWNKYF